MMSLQRLASGPESLSNPATRSLPHVLFLVDGFPKSLGGGERVVLRLAALLPQYGFRASIITFQLHPESSFRASEAPCPVYLLPLTNTYGPRAWRAALTLRRYLRREEVRVVQTFFESSDLWGGLVTRLLSPAKLIWSRRDMGILRGPKHTRAYRALRALPHAVMAVSQRVADHVIAVDGVTSSRVHVVYNGLDLAPQVRSRPAGGAPVIATIGNIRHVKGHDLLVETAAEVVKYFPDVHFLIAGGVLEPEYFHYLQRRIEELGLKDTVIFAGGVSDLVTFLSQADLFVLPSRSEGFSNALIEAMALGLPVVATDVGGNAEAVLHGESGLIVSPEDAKALTAAVMRLLRDPATAERMGRAARQRATEQFTAAAMMRRTTEIYRALLQEDVTP